MSAATKRTLRNCARAYADKSHLASAMQDLYTYILPYRKPANSQMGHNGGPKMNQVYDSTAIRGAFRFAGRMQQDVTPPGTEFWELEVNDALPVAREQRKAWDDERKKLNEDLQTVSKMVKLLIEKGDFANASSEMYLDLFGGTGAMLILKDEKQIAKFVAVPFHEVAIAEDGFGAVTRIYWEREYDADALEGMWAEMKIPEELQKIIDETPEQKVVIIQATEFNKKTSQWDFSVIWKAANDDTPPIHASTDRTCPWITPRFYKVPGEVQGRGPGLMALPTVKTLNKVTELTVKAAAFAILGLWTYRDDRVFNPRTSPMRPGAMWKIGSNGFSGDTIKRLDVPARFDVSNLILQDLREQVKQITLDDSLPPDAGAVRSATEIVERMKRLATDLAGAYGRLSSEIVVPVVRRCIDILQSFGFIENDWSLDELFLRVKITSPIARAHQAQDVTNILEWLQMLEAVGGKELVMLSARVEDIGTEIGRKLGVREGLVRSEVEKGELQKQVAGLIAAQQAPQQAEAPPQPVVAAT